jgi:hypothetical protein
MIDPDALAVFLQNEWERGRIWWDVQFAYERLRREVARPFQELITRPPTTLWDQIQWRVYRWIRSATRRLCPWIRTRRIRRLEAEFYREFMRAWCVQAEGGRPWLIGSI